MADCVAAISPPRFCKTSSLAQSWQCRPNQQSTVVSHFTSWFLMSHEHLKSLGAAVASQPWNWQAQNSCLSAYCLHFRQLGSPVEVVSSVSCCTGRSICKLFTTSGREARLLLQPAASGYGVMQICAELMHILHQWHIKQPSEGVCHVQTIWQGT